MVIHPYTGRPEWVWNEPINFLLLNMIWKYKHSLSPLDDSWLEMLWLWTYVQGPNHLLFGLKFLCRSLIGEFFFPYGQAMVVANVLKLSQVSLLLIDVSNFQSSSIELELMVMLGNFPCSCRSYLKQIGRTSISYWFLFVVWNGISGQISAWFAMSVCNDLVRTSGYAHSNSKCGNILFVNEWSFKIHFGVKRMELLLV